MSHRPDIDEIKRAYDEYGSVWKAGAALGMSGQQVHKVLTDAGLINHINVFTDEERDRLIREYVTYRDAGQLQRLADDMGRTKHFICRQARALGLTNKAHERPYGAVWKYLTEDAAAVIWDTFKASSKNLGQFCDDAGYDDLGFSRCMKRHFGDEWEHVIEAKAGRQSKYRAGRQFEYRVRDDLRARGFWVLRSPASKSPVDLVAISKGRVVFIQCKRGGGISVAEWNAIYDLAESVDAEPVLASMPGYRGIKYQRMLARKTGIRGVRQPIDDWNPLATTDRRLEART